MPSCEQYLQAGIAKHDESRGLSVSQLQKSHRRMSAHIKVLRNALTRTYT